jgi:periplasmic divalent cation tolerance protein
MRKRCGMFIAWTTLATRAEAEKMATDVVARGLAACAQVEGPIISFYIWQGRPERMEEFRLCLKCLPDKLAALEAHVLGHHPYALPEWVVVRAEHVGEKYLSWAGSNATNLPL